MNAIETIRFDFRMQDEIFARELYARWDSFFAANVERIANEILAKYDSPTKNLEIGRFELDLGIIPENEFDEQFAVRFRQRLEDALLQCLHNPKPGQKTKVTLVPRLVFDLLKQFLLTGILPWHVAAEYRDVRHLFLTVLKKNARQFKQFLQTYGHYTSLQERLVYQLNDTQLERGVYLLEAAAGGFIVSYVKLLKAKYKALEQPGIQESDYRNMLWFVVYAYLLTNRSSYFDKKSFIETTITRLAGKYRLSYEQMIHLLTRELKQFLRSLSMPLELFHILEQLQEELSEKQLKASLVDVAKFVKTAYSTLESGVVPQESDTLLLEEIFAAVRAQKILNKAQQKQILLTLSDAFSRRRFIDQSKEPQRYELIKLLFPQEEELIITYAKNLDYLRQNNKTSSGFESLKWDFLFAVLSSENQNTFNRRQFVRKTLQDVAAHYNLTYFELLLFFMQENIAAFVPLLLYGILNELCMEERNAWLTIALKNPNTKDRQTLLKSFAPNLTSENLDFVKKHIVFWEKYFALLQSKGKLSGDYTRFLWQAVFESASECIGSFDNKRFSFLVLHKIATFLHTSIDKIWDDSIEIDQIKNIAEYNSISPIIQQWQTGTRKISNQNRLSPAVTTAIFFDKNYDQESVNLLNKILENKQFSLVIKNDLPLFMKLKEYINRTFHLQIEDRDLLKFIYGLSKKHFSLSRAEIARQLSEWFERQLTGKQKERFRQETKKYNIFKNITKMNAKIQSEESRKKDNEQETQKQVEQKIFEDRDEARYINNAGMVLFSPYYPQLFSMLGLTENSQFKDRNAQVKAIYLLQYVVFERTDFEEHELVLNKLLVGMKTHEPIENDIQLSQEEIQAVDAMMHGVLQNWDKMKNTSLTGLRQAFLQRDGRVNEYADMYFLIVEEKTYDMLLDSLPWSFKTIKYRWTEKMLLVKWR